MSTYLIDGRRAGPGTDMPSLPSPAHADSVDPTAQSRRLPANMAQPMRGTLLAVTAAVAALLYPASPATAEVRAGDAWDAQEATPTLDGSPRQTDIERVWVSYDTAGSFSATIRFYEALPASSSYNVGVYATAVETDPQFRDLWYCDTLSTGDPSFFADAATGGGTANLSVWDYSGSVTATRSLSADGQELTLTASHAALANRDLRCVTATLSRPDPDGHCSPSLSDCRRISYSYTVDTVDEFYFRGYEPPSDPPADETEPARTLQLSTLAARRHVRTVLARRYGSRYRKRRGFTMRCRRQSASRVRCAVSWRYRIIRYKGSVTVFAIRGGGWDHRTSIRRARIDR